VALSLAGRILEISEQNSQDADSLCTPIFSANRGIFWERWGYFLRISAFRRDLMGKQCDFTPRFRAKYALFARWEGYFSHTSNRIGPNQQSKRCGEPIAFLIRVERRNHGLFPLSRTRKESFLPSGPGGRNSFSVLCVSDVRGWGATSWARGLFARGKGLGFNRGPPRRSLRGAVRVRAGRVSRTTRVPRE
jgi:hypothetical protein